MLIRTNCNNKVHSLKFSMVNSSLILDFALQEVARSCWGLKRRCMHWCMEILSPGEGVTNMRAVGVNSRLQAAPWRLAGARPALAEAPAVCAGWSAPRLPARALPVLWRGRPRRQLMCASAWREPAPGPALLADAKQPCGINVPFVAPLYLQTAQFL